MSEFYLDEDTVVEIIASVLMLAHFGALVWSWRLRKGIAPVVALNLILSGAVVLYWALHIADLRGSIEALWAFVAVETAVFMTSVVAALGVRVPRAVIWVEFAMHTLLIAAALSFMFTFKLTRLI